MGICKNAVEYQRKLESLMADFYRNVTPKEMAIHTKYKDLIENAELEKFRELVKNEDNEIKILYDEGMKKIENFLTSQPERPIYIFKANRKYYKLKINYLTGEFSKEKNPIPSTRLLESQKPGWIIKLEFPNSAFDFVICPNCNREFERFQPHEKYCFMCQRSPRSKRPLLNHSQKRYCHNPGCNKQIPAGKNRRAKYCCNACRVNACEKRKKIISPVDSGEPASF